MWCDQVSEEKENEKTMNNRVTEEELEFYPTSPLNNGDAPNDSPPGSPQHVSEQNSNLRVPVIPIQEINLPHFHRLTSYVNRDILKTLFKIRLYSYETTNYQTGLPTQLNRHMTAVGEGGISIGDVFVDAMGEMPRVVRELCEDVNSYFNTLYNSVLIVKFENGDHRVGFHVPRPGSTYVGIGSRRVLFSSESWNVSFADSESHPVIYELPDPMCRVSVPRSKFPIDSKNFYLLKFYHFV